MKHSTHSNINYTMPKSNFCNNINAFSFSEKFHVEYVVCDNKVYIVYALFIFLGGILANFKCKYVQITLFNSFVIRF